MGFTTPNSNNGNFTGRMPQQPVQQVQPANQTNWIVTNGSRLANLLQNAISSRVQRFELNPNAAQQCGAQLRSQIMNGVYSNRLFNMFGNNPANDNQLYSFADLIVNEWIEIQTRSGANVRGNPNMYQQPVNQYGQPVYNQPVNQFGQPVYNQPVNQFGQPVNQFGQPIYNQPVNQFGQPVYNQPVNQFGQPVNQFNQFNQPTFNQFRQRPVNQFGQPMQQRVNQFGQPVNQFGQPVYNQPVNQYGQPVNQFGQPINGAVPPANQFRQPAYQQPNAQGGGSTFDELYSQSSQATNGAMRQSAPVQNVSATRVHSQQPHVATCTNAAQPVPPVQPVSQPKQKSTQPATKLDKEIMLNLADATTFEDCTKEEIEEMYPDDDVHFRDKYLKLIKIMTTEYIKHVYGIGVAPDLQKETVSTHVVELADEPCVNDNQAIRKVLADNKKHDDSKPFSYKIHYNKQVVLDVPYDVGVKAHNDLAAVWKQYLDGSDPMGSMYEIYETRPFDVAKSILKKFKFAPKQYQKAVEPIILKSYNDVMNTAGLFKTATGYQGMNEAKSIDDIYAAIDIADMTKYGDIKRCEYYIDVVRNAINNSLFAMYAPTTLKKYLDYKDPADRAAALANPAIGVTVNYTTDRWLAHTHTLDNKLTDKDCEKLVNNELRKHFVIVMRKSVVYTNVDAPFAAKPKSVDFRAQKLDIFNGATKLFINQTIPATIGHTVPNVVFANDPTTMALPWVFTQNATGQQLARRVIA